MTKTLFGAIALAIAVPAFAQGVPAADPHAGHKSEQKHDCKACCEKMKGKDGKMECMDKKGEAKPAEPKSGDHQAHSGHAH